MSDEDLSPSGGAEPTQVQPEPSEAVTAETTETETPESQTEQEQVQEQGDIDASQSEEGEGGKQPDPTEEEKKRRKQKSADERFGQITAKRREAEREAAANRAEAERLQKRLELYEGPAPREEDFDNYEDFETARDNHRQGQFLKQERERDLEDVNARVEASDSTALQASYEEYQARADAFKEQAPDYDQVVEGPNAAFSEQMARELFTSPKGPQIAYHLAKNPTELVRIARLTEPTDVAREIARVEGRLTQPTPKRVTTAPDPVKAVATGSGSQADNDPSKMSVAEMQKMFKKDGVLS